jgi:hypothetical protein
MSTDQWEAVMQAEDVRIVVEVGRRCWGWWSDGDRLGDLVTVGVC